MMDESMIDLTQEDNNIDDELNFDDNDLIEKSLMNDISIDNDNNDDQEDDVKKFKIPSPLSDLINNELFTSTTRDLPKCRLEFNETPRNIYSNNDNNDKILINNNGNRKRKNFSRRCLSTDLNDFHKNDNELTFQEFRCSKIENYRINESLNKSSSTTTTTTILSQIENKILPRTTTPKSYFNNRIELELTPEFNNEKKFDENDVPSSSKIKCMKSTPTSAKTNNSTTTTTTSIPIQKYFSENHATIIRAVNLSANDSTLIGDFTRTYALPLMIKSKHQDLRTITCHVLAKLLNNNYNNVINTYRIIDCRYPYEYDGGHIRTAINIYTQDQIMQEFLMNKKFDKNNTSNNNDDDKRDILIFHCEFSSERGPSLYRFLRNKDRVKNSRNYPNLYYPEIYLLEGGYKEFFQHYSNLCEPCSYRPMHSKSHEEDMKKFRTICKSLDYKYSSSSSSSSSTSTTTMIRKRNLRL